MMPGSDVQVQKQMTKKIKEDLASAVAGVLAHEASILSIDTRNKIAGKVSTEVFEYLTNLFLLG
jgi:hypothetical protein